MAAVQPYVKKAVAVSSVADIPAGVAQAFHAALEGSPGPTYVDLPADVLLNAIGGEEAAAAVASIPERPQKQLVSAPDADVKAAADIIRSASK